ncbi:MAG: ascorbate-dependent monooxygenase [Acidobacteriota bacterium]|nr:ascorbate-dependent monooxygenase [Acidobacteriota bacterium]
MLAPFIALALAASAPLPAPVFTRDIAPILLHSCAGCHHAGEVAPFPLITYADAKSRAKLIAEVTRSRLMPPWQPVAGYGHFAGERRLTPAQIAAISRWAAAGAPEGDPKFLPKPPEFHSGWQLGTPDLVVTLPEPMDIPADGPDIYECFVVPMNNPATYIRAVEFRPANRRITHHSLLFTDASHIKREPRYTCFGTIGLLPTLGIGGWSPGNEAIRMLDHAALPLQANSRLVAQVHYHPDGKPERDQWQVGFYFTDQAPSRRVVDVGLASNLIDIPAGDSHYVVRQHFTIPIAIDAVGIIPHAHLICREMRGWAILPDGTKRWLLYIKNWDFNWQDQYRYATPIRLPADTRIEMEFVYDNSAANPRNPHSPPQRVRWGPGTDDEMAGLHVQSIPVHMEELPQLGQALWGAVMRSLGGRIYTPPSPQQ